jgi:hypothetical protein
VGAEAQLATVQRTGDTQSETILILICLGLFSKLQKFDPEL